MFRAALQAQLDRKYRSPHKRSGKLEAATQGVIEPLERRVLMSSVQIVVTGDGDGINSPLATYNSSTHAFDATTLRDAVSYANTLSNSATITFAGSLAGGTIVLTGGTLVIASTSTAGTYIDASNLTGGITVQGDGAATATVFQVNSGCTATLDGLAITSGGNARTSGGGIYSAGTLSVVNCNLFKNNASDGAGIFNAGYLALSGDTIGGAGSDTNDAATNGGALCNASGAVIDSIVGCHISGDGAVDNGAGIYDKGVIDAIDDTQIENDTADGSGGGLFVGGSGTATVVDETGTCTFVNDLAEGGSGGGIASEGTLVTVSNAYFSSDTVSSGGGAVYGASGAATVLVGGNITDNNSDFDGGGVFNEGTLTMTGVTVTYNTSTSFGGGIKSDGLATISYCAVEDNTVSAGPGGGITSGGGVLDVVGCNVSDNVAAGSTGGGINADSTDYLSNDTVFGNTAHTDGGGIWLEGSTGTVQYCNVYSDQTEQGNGGGIYASVNDSISNCSVYDDTVGGNGKQGGGLYLTDGTATACQLYGNEGTGEGDEGGGAYLSSGMISLCTLTTCQLTSNAGGEGGGIYATSSGTVIACQISSDSVAGFNGKGGGAYISGAEMSNCSITGSNATDIAGTGGGVFVNSGTLLACQVNGDSSAGNGGGIAVAGAAYLGEDCIIAGDSATDGGGIYCTGNYNSDTITDTGIFSDTASGNGGGVYLDGGSTEITGSAVGTDIPGRTPNNDGGITAEGDSAENGGGIYITGGADLLAFIAGHIDDDSASDDGAGIYVDNGTIYSLESTTISDDTAGSEGGGIFVGSSGTVDGIEYCTVDGDSAADAGGGVYSAGRIEDHGVEYSMVSYDSVTGAGGDGGGIAVSNYLKIRYSTVAADYAAGEGGGVYDSGDGGEFKAYNSTIANNTAGGDGGGIFLSLSSYVAAVDNCTISGDSAGDAGGGVYLHTTTAYLNDAIVAGNTISGDAAASDISYATGDPLESTSADNLIGTGGSGGLSGGANKNVVGVSVSSLDLAPLGYHGGATPTMPPLAGSPATTGSFTLVNTSLQSDQRGTAFFAFTSDEKSDIADIDAGALQVGTTVQILQVNTTADAGTLSLRQAIEDANSFAGPTKITFDTTVFTPSSTGTITFASTLTSVISSGSDTTIYLPASGLDLVGTIVNDGVLNFVGGGYGDRLTVGLTGTAALTGAITGTGGLTLGSSVTPTYLRLAPVAALGTDTFLPAVTNSQSQLVISSASALDLTNNTFYVNYGTGTDPIAEIVAYLTTGYNGGGTNAWSGTLGIVSSAVMTLNSGQSHTEYSIGYADGAYVPEVDGVPVVSGLSSGQIEIMPTLAGDAKLVGAVLTADRQIVDNFWLYPGSWDQGDFTYDDWVQVTDYQAIDEDIGQNDSSLFFAPILGG
jgi:hypothetical protein